MSRRFKILFPGLMLLSLLLGGCVYFNTFFNAQKAYDQAIRMREKRLAKDPEDSVVVTPEEKLKFERAIAKCSKLLELYPERTDYGPKALFLMGESYLLMEDYGMAVEKYEELARYYPTAPQNPLAEIHRAKAFYLDGKMLKARDAVQIVLKKNPSGEILREALLLAAHMEMDGDSASAGLTYFDKFLEQKGLSDDVRADVHWEAAKLSFNLGQWERARGHALAPEHNIYADKFKYRNERLALLCKYREKQFADGIDEAKHLYKQKGYGPYRPDIKVLMGRGREGLGDWKAAENLYRQVPRMKPRGAPAAEAFYRLGDHYFEVLRQEDSAKVYFDSSAAVGQSFEFGALAAEKSRALSRIAELRKAKPDSVQPHYSSFMIAELFLFNLSQVDSALARLNQIVASNTLDSTHTIRAAYARAYIQEEFKKNKPVGDSLYRYVLEKFPNTEWAKQAEKNLGLKPTVQTDEDRAHTLFLEAEKLRFGGEDVSKKVVPAYRMVYGQYPRTQFAPKALFVMAFLREGQAHELPPVHGSLDSAKVAYYTLNKKYHNTVYGRIAGDKMVYANFTKADMDSLFTKANGDSSKVVSEGGSTSTDAAVEDTTEEETGKKRKEVLEPGVDDY